MYRFNDIVKIEDKVGRVLSHNTITHKVYVLVRTGDFTWIQEKWDDLLCKKAKIPLWDLYSVFKIRYNRMERTPELKSMDDDGDHIMSLY